MLQKLEDRHKLTPSKDWRRDTNGAERHMYVYDPKELAKIPLRDRSSLRSPGELAARAFEMFDEGKNIREIVIALRELPNTIEDLKLQWDGMGGSDRVITPLAWEKLASMVGNFTSVADLIKRIEGLVNASLEITTGNDEPALSEIALSNPAL